MMYRYEKISEEVNILIMAALEGSASQGDIDRLGKMIEHDQEIRHYYIEMVALHVNLFESKGIATVDGGEDIGHRVFQQAVEEKLNDESIRQHLNALNTAGETKKEPTINFRRKVSPKDRIQILVRVAALLMICIGIIWLDRMIVRKPVLNTRREVARLVDEIDATWDSKLQLPLDSGGLLQEQYHLISGIVRIQFNNGAEVVIEGPADWMLNSEDNLFLTYGQLYATVSNEATGFSVNSPHVKIVDMGTEFGVKIENNGDAELHVTNGKTVLFSEQKDKKVNLEVTAGHAKRVLSGAKTIETIQCNGQKFVQKIDSSKQLIWKGEEALDLADIVVGGNGLKTGKEWQCLNVDTGKLEAMDMARDGKKNNSNSSPYYWSYMGPINSSRDYVNVENPYIDGVFVPYKIEEGFVIAENGLRFKLDVDVNGKRYDHISNGSFYRNGQKCRIFQGGTWYEAKKNPCIYMHANIGITFDLNKIRETYSYLELKRFKAICGNGQNENLDDKKGKTNFYILVDGQVRKKIEQVKPTDGVPVDIALNPNDHYLTLITAGKENDMSFARSHFGLPVITTERKK